MNKSMLKAGKNKGICPCFEMSAIEMFAGSDSLQLFHTC